jgi:hypothetical protein
MTDTATVISKVLVLDSNPDCQQAIKDFCASHHLSALRVNRGNLLSVLRSNVDLGAILIAERIGEDEHAGIELGRQVHALRPELPIFLRREQVNGLEDLSLADRSAFTAGYAVGNITDLEPIIQDSIFCQYYPNALVRGITEITQGALNSQFQGLEVHIDTPYIVRDRLIYGEIFTLIPIESPWCRGYMSLQAVEEHLQQMVKANHTHISAADGDDFRNLNGLLGELTNLIWGAFKNRYGQLESSGPLLAQVPIIINHLHRYISFGSSDPQLCFRCTLTNPKSPSMTPIVIYQRFIFNLSWRPEDFMENQASVDNLVSTGELELF